MMALDIKALRRSDIILCRNVPAHVEVSNPPFFTIDGKRSALSDQHDQLRAWQALAVPAAGAGIGLVIDIRDHYAFESHLVTSLESIALASSGCDLRSRSPRPALARWRGERYQ